MASVRSAKAIYGRGVGVGGASWLSPKTRYRCAMTLEFPTNVFLSKRKWEDLQQPADGCGTDRFRPTSTLRRQHQFYK